MQIIKCSDLNRIRHLTYVLERDRIDYKLSPPEKDQHDTFEMDEQGYLLYRIILPNATEEDIEIIKEDTDCEIERYNSNNFVPVISYKTEQNSEKKNRILKGEGYTYLKKDKEKFEKNL